jgi:hypothetical protein
MSNAPQRFGRLAAQFEVMAHNLTVCQNPKQRRELLRGMMVILNQFEDILRHEHSSLDSKQASASSANPPLSKATHG